LTLAALAGARDARADGAFADSQRLFLPPERPAQLVLATNFGLVTSDDGGRRWSWVCEQPLAPDATAYQLGPPPARRLFAIARGAAVHTDDLGCTWSAGSLPGDARALDVFPDSNDASRVYLGAGVGPASEQRTVLLVSRDGGQSFPTVLYTPPVGAVILGVESTGTFTIYLSLRQGPGTHPHLARSDDGGQSWQLFDVEATTGASDLGIIAADGRRLYLRVRGFPDETLAISDDGGATVRVAARIPSGVLSAFGRRADGTLLIAGINSSGGVVLSSADGLAWAPWITAPLVRDFAERGGILHVLGDDARDRFTIAASATAGEDGTGLRRLMGFADVTSVRACAVATCAAACQAEVARGTFAASVCDAPPPSPDAGTDARVDAPSTTPAPRSGGCSFGGPPACSGLVVLGLLAIRVGSRTGRCRTRPCSRRRSPSVGIDTP